MEDPAESTVAGSAEAGTSEELTYQRVRVAFITPGPIAAGEAFEQFADGIEWPSELGDVPRDRVERLGSLRRTFDSDGTYTTWLRVSVSGDMDTLGDMEGVDFYKLESECRWTINSKAERAMEGVTRSGIPATVFGGGELAVTRDDISVIVGIHSQERISDLKEWAANRHWPTKLGEVHVDVDKSLTSKLPHDSRGGYRTVVRMTFSGDMVGFEELDDVDFVRLDDGISSRLNSKAQRALDNITSSGLSATVEPAMAQAGPLVELDTFASDIDFTGVDGSGYSVVVIDSGIDLDHPYFGVDTDANGVADRIVYQRDFADNDYDASDVSGHGTNVAGIAASESTTHPGVAPGADIIVLKVFPDSGSDSGTAIEDALAWVASNVSAYNIASVNMSLSMSWAGLADGPFTEAVTNYPISDEIAAIAAQGVTVVSASGNGYKSNGAEGVAYPSADANSLSVGAVYDTNIGSNVVQHGATAYTTAADRIAAFSERDSNLTSILAPGSKVTSAWLGGTTNTYFGTSQAAPHVAGAVLLMQDLAQQEFGRLLSPREFENLIQETGAAIHDGSADGNTENDNVSNTGDWFRRLDIHAAAEALADDYHTFDAGNDKNDGTKDVFEVKRSGGYLQVWVNSTLKQSLSATTTMGINLVGSNDEDEVWVRDLGDFDGIVHFEADEDTGVDDVVYVYDSTGDDTFFGYPAYSETLIEDAYVVVTTATYAHFYASSTGTDTAFFYGDAFAKDRFKSYTDEDLVADGNDNWSKMLRNGVYQNRQKWCENVKAYADMDTGDVSYFYDNEGDDEFLGAMGWSHHHNHQSNGNETFDVWAYDFEVVTAYSDEGGADLAYLYDSVLEDMFRARPHKSSIYDTDEDVYEVVARNFDVVFGYALATNADSSYVDQAKLHDDVVPNDYVLAAAAPNEAGSNVFFYKDYPNIDLMYAAYGFDWVKCYSMNGRDYRNDQSNGEFTMIWGVDGTGTWSDI